MIWGYPHFNRGNFPSGVLPDMKEWCWSLGTAFEHYWMEICIPTSPEVTLDILDGNPIYVPIIIQYFYPIFWWSSWSWMDICIILYPKILQSNWHICLWYSIFFVHPELWTSAEKGLDLTDDKPDGWTKTPKRVFFGFIVFWCVL